MIREAHVYKDGFGQYTTVWYWENCLPTRTSSFTLKGAIKEIYREINDEKKPSKEPLFSYVRVDISEDDTHENP